MKYTANSFIAIVIITIINIRAHVKALPKISTSLTIVKPHLHIYTVVHTNSSMASCY